MVWKGLTLFADGCKLFYWFRVVASCKTRNSPYTCGKHTAGSSKVFWCRTASLGWPCNTPQPEGIHHNPGATSKDDRSSKQFVSPHPQLTAVLNHQCWIKHADSRHFLRALSWGFWGEEEESRLGAPWMLHLFFDASRHLWLERVPAPRHCWGGQCRAHGCSAQLAARAAPSPPSPAASTPCSLNSTELAVSEKSQEQSSCSHSRTAVKGRAHESRENYSSLLALQQALTRSSRHKLLKNELTRRLLCSDQPPTLSSAQEK